MRCCRTTIFLQRAAHSRREPGRAAKTDTGEGAVLAPRTISDNKIQLKFATKEFVGEYFHYTGDLFLIYPSGQLARLNCSPA